MNPKKIPLWLEMVHDIVEYLFYELHRKRKHEAALKAREAMKALIDLKNAISLDEEMDG